MSDGVLVSLDAMQELLAEQAPEVAELLAARVAARSA